jgi:hypothetical protein
LGHEAEFLFALFWSGNLSLTGLPRQAHACG